jgi:hypothetical protein
LWKLKFWTIQLKKKLVAGAYTLKGVLVGCGLRLIAAGISNFG